MLTMPLSSRPSLRAGLDDLSASSRGVSGWAFCILDSASADILESRLGAAGIEALHANEFETLGEQSPCQYQTALTIIRETIDQATQSELGLALLAPSWFQDRNASLVAVTNEAARGAVINSRALVEAAMPGLLMLLRRSGSFGRAPSIRIEVDHNQVTRKHAGRAVSVISTSAHASVTGTQALAAIYRAWRTSKFPETPELSSDGLAFVEDERSRLVQAADLFGNFALANIWGMTGVQGSGRKRKTAIFNEIFGDLQQSQPGKLVCNVNGLQLAESDELFFHIGRGGDTASQSPAGHSAHESLPGTHQ